MFARELGSLTAEINELFEEGITPPALGAVKDVLASDSFVGM